MQEFSEYVGLSRPTVSKFFNDPMSVKAKTRLKISEAAKEVNFQPNMLAVNFKRKQTNLIGIVIPDHTDPFYASLTQQITHLANEAGMISMVLSSDGDEELQARSISTIMGMQVAGVIMVLTGIDDKKSEITQLTNSIPTVFVDAYTPLANQFVGNDNVQSITLIVEYLLRSGSEPCYFPMPSVNTNAILREKTYTDVMKNLGCEPKIVSVDKSLNWDFEAFAYQQTEKLLKTTGFPSDTILCANDRLAYGVMSACRAAGLKVGRNADDDIRIAGHDDHPLARYTFPPLTTVRQNTSTIAATATETLIQMMQSEKSIPNKKVLVDSSLQLRKSS